MAVIIKPPMKPDLTGMKSVFLAGTIDNGDAADWQVEMEKQLADRDVIILNPRRDEWDSSWEQSIENAQFKEQVEWELDGLEQASIVFMYFAPDSRSPITLLELGLMARSDKLIVVASRGYWKRGNIEVAAQKFGFPIYESLEAGIERIKELI